MTRNEWSTRSGRSSSWITKTRRLAIYIRDEFKCQYCGRDLREADPRDVALDHLHPRCFGGSNDSTNLIMACRACNSGRQERPYTQYATPGAVLRIRKTIRRKVNTKLAAAILAGRSQIEETLR